MSGTLGCRRRETAALVAMTAADRTDRGHVARSDDTSRSSDRRDPAIRLGVVMQNGRLHLRRLGGMEKVHTALHALTRRTQSAVYLRTRADRGVPDLLIAGGAAETQQGRRDPMVELNRRQFLKLGAGGLLGLYVGIHRGLHQVAQASPPVAPSTLDPLTVPKFVTPLLIPPVMPKAGISNEGGKNVDYYEISMKQFSQQILPAGLPATTVWGYGAVTAPEQERVLLLHNAPSLTIEARWNRPVRVKWINDLKDAQRQLPAAPAAGRSDAALGQPARRHRGPRHASDSSPALLVRTPARCRSSRTCTARSASAMRATATPKPGICLPPTIFRRVMPPKARGTTSSKAKPRPSFGAPGDPDLPFSNIPNANRASTIWYHDHALGMTRLNVYAGPAGFYIIRGGPAGDDAVLDTRIRHAGGAAGSRPARERQVPAKQDLLRDSNCNPGSILQRRRLALLPGHARVLRWRHR